MREFGLPKEIFRSPDQCALDAAQLGQLPAASALVAPFRSPIQLDCAASRPAERVGRPESERADCILRSLVELAPLEPSSR